MSFVPTDPSGFRLYGYERCDDEDDAWAAFDSLWGRFTPRERMEIAQVRSG